MMFKYYKNDKEFEQDKAIEEMADYIFGNAITHDTQFKEDCRSIAIDLYNAGYRKIPENAVVLTDDEYERWQGKTLNIKKVRKETAEKFAEMLKEKLEERKKICLERWKRYEKEGETDLACYWNGKENEIHCVKADIYETCKEIIGEEK